MIAVNPSPRFGRGPVAPARRRKLGKGRSMSMHPAGPRAPVSPETLREQFLGAMSRAVQTVNVVTSDGPAGRVGMTVSAMTSVSADTALPTLLVCLNQAARATPAVLENGRFVVNVLRDDQAYIADAFAGRLRNRLADRFSVTDWAAMPSGLPRVARPLAAFDCRLASASLIGTHHVITGEVAAIHQAPAGQPLLYTHRHYGSPGHFGADPDDRALGQAPQGRLSFAYFHSFGPHVLPELLRRLAAEGPIEISLIEGDQRRVEAALLAGEAELAMIYDMGISPDLIPIPLTDIVPYVLLPAAHPLARAPGLSAADLAQEPMILLSTPPKDGYFLRLMRAGGVEPKIAFRSTSFEMVRGLVGQGLGVALLATRPAATISYDGHPLAAVPFITDEPPGRIVLACRPGTPLSPAAERFALLAQDHFATDA